jgi:UDP:flavonoid glycosyltransferase YjiC (YdhE family)
MRVTIPTTGSRGDVQPYVALGVGLRERGHEVCLATHIDFEGFVRDHGLDFYPLAAAGRALQASQTGDRMLHAGSRPFAFLKEYTRLRRPLLHDLMRRAWLACRGADVILATNPDFLLADAIAERERLPMVWTALQPVAPSRFQPNCLFPSCPSWVPGSSLYHLATHAVTGFSMWLLLRRELNRARQDVLGLPPLPYYGPVGSFIAPRLCLHGYSAFVAPPPCDWGACHHVTGYWFLDTAAAWQAPAPLLDFLAAGATPICIGFGSMHDRDAARVTSIVVSALEQTGQRGILLTGWGGLNAVRTSSRVFALAAAPHDWLFPRVAAVVHHGGAGATAAAVRAGVPSLAVPFMSDQPFWGHRLHALGVAPRPIPHRHLSVARLAQGIRRMLGDEPMRRRAAELGAGVRAEEGVKVAVGILEQHFRTGFACGERVSARAALRSFFGAPPAPRQACNSTGRPLCETAPVCATPPIS